MGPIRSGQQAHRNAINIQRMLSRLEAATEKQRQQPSTSYTTSKEYYKTLSTLSSIRNAEKLLDETELDDQTRLDVAPRLAKLESHYQSILTNTPKPHASPTMPSLEHLRPPVMPAELADSTGQNDVVAEERGIVNAASAGLPTPELQAAHALLPLGGDETIDEGGAGLHRRRSSLNTMSDAITPLSSSNTYEATKSGRGSLARNTSSYTSSGKKDTPSDTQSLSNLLSHHRSEQESLTEELATMASRLKMNSLEFSQLLEKDKGLLEKADEQLDGNLTGMIKERDRLKDYKKKGGVTTWFVIGSVLAVLFAWLFMFALMRIF